jgi:arsenite-transporting ATPase
MKLDLRDRRVLFVGGKGGTGKTVTAASLALTTADSGRKCLLVSTDPAHSLSDVFDIHIGDRETILTPLLSAIEIDPGATAKRHIAAVAGSMRKFTSPAMYDEVERHLKLVQTSPGAMEAALLERISELLIEGTDNYDLIIFDTAPTGHTLHLLSLPEMMSTWTDALLANRERSGKLHAVLDGFGDLPENNPAAGAGGSVKTPGYRSDRDEQLRAILLQRRSKFRQARQVLTNRETTAFILVLNPEKLAILESKNALVSLQQYDIHVLAIVINRVLPATADGDFLARRRVREQAYLAEIEHAFKGCRHHYLPLLAGDICGMDDLRKIGQLLINTD